MNSHPFQHGAASMLLNISYCPAYTSTEITMSKMSHLKVVLVLLALFAMPALAGEEKHLLYFTSPDGAQGGVGNGTPYL